MIGKSAADRAAGDNWIRREPATVAVGAAPELARVTLVTASRADWSNPLAVNSVPENVTESPYVFGPIISGHESVRLGQW